MQEQVFAFHMVKKVTISSKGQITLPEDLRDKYHMSYGESVIVADSGEGIIIRHGNGTLRGMLKGNLDTEGFEKDIEGLRKEWKL
ncbi:MAG: AbrB/MazE/SpoVT family DNA-binding domain-containing protein [Candidatus Thermoplasmatota archaeon]|nr:AbrB/MazE/SpoVT family DNA-binding domain-containing protein [Candidatus Thermoplasmatota archaeon]